MRKGFVTGILLAALGIWQWIGTVTDTKIETVRQIRQSPMKNILQERQEALKSINRLRQEVGLSRMKEDQILQKAAQAHAEYLVRHHLSSHYEKVGEEGFTGTKPVDRALKAGYHSRLTGENLSTKHSTAKKSIEGLFSAIYHRYGFLNPDFDEIGIGIAQDSDHPQNSAFVYLMGNHEIDRLCSETYFKGKGRYVYGICADTKHRIDAAAYEAVRRQSREQAPVILVYPYDGQKDVSPAFYQENPDPLPEYDVSGYPVSVIFNDRYLRKADLLSFRLFEVVSGKEVTDVRLLDHQTDLNHKLTRHQFVLLPLQRLQYGTSYRAEISYRHNRKQEKLSWNFTTRQPGKTLIPISQKECKLTLRPGKGYWLYFVPRTPQDILGTMRYPRDLNARFIDSNTLQIFLDPNRSKGFEITGSGRKIQIEIAR